MHVATRTAVIVPVPEAEPAVAVHRIRLDRAASWGVPAHVTVLFPFVSPSQVDDGVIDALRSVFASQDAFDCTFSTCAWFGQEVVWLAPDPDARFRGLTNAVVERFPDLVPYAGEFDDVVPHLTIGEARLGMLADLQAAEADVRRALPITARIDHAVLIAGAERRGSWRTVARLPFGVRKDGLDDELS